MWREESMVNVLRVKIGFDEILSIEYYENYSKRGNLVSLQHQIQAEPFLVFHT